MSPKASLGKWEILIKAYELFRKHGYHAASLNDLAECCGIRKASLYHYFKQGKQQIMEEVLGYVINYTRERLINTSTDTSRSPRQRMQRIGEKMLKFYQFQTGGCVMGNILLETAQNNKAFHPYFEEFFNAWEDAFFNILQHQYEEKIARKKARRYVREFQGAIMMMQVSKNSQPLEEFTENILDELPE